jgi:hypothetical protein
MADSSIVDLNGGQVNGVQVRVPVGAGSTVTGE